MTRLAVIGAGWWAWTAHLPGARADPDIELVAVCDPDPDRAAAAAAEFGGTPATRLDAVLTDERVEAVVIATPHHTHAELIRAALTAGRHVLVEKPMVLDGPTAWELVELARDRDRRLCAGLTYQYCSTAGRVRQAVLDEIGELVSISADFPSATAALFARTDPADDHREDPTVAHGTTFSDPRTGGGQLYSQVTHLLGAVCFASHDQATRVAAFTTRRGLAVDVVDALSFRMSSGALGVATSTGTTPGGVSPGQPVRFHGTAGSVQWNLHDSTATIDSPTGRRRVAPEPGEPAYPRERVVQAFARLIRGDGPDLGPADDAAASIALLDAAHRSARTGAFVDVVQGRLEGGRS